MYINKKSFMLEKEKQAQKELVEKLGSLENWVKCGFLNIVDIQHSWMNPKELENDIYSIGIRSCEHPEGFVSTDKIAPVFRIRNGKIIRDTGGRADSFFWGEKAYNKFKKAAKECFFIGTQTGVYLENLYRIRKELNDSDGQKLTYMVAQRTMPLEVIDCSDEFRKVVVVTEEICETLCGKILNSWDEKIEDASILEVGDLLVQEDDSGFYYRVDKKQAEQTYEKVD